DADAARRDLLDHFKAPPGLLDAERRKRFVQQDELAAPVDEAVELNGLALATCKMLDPRAQRGDGGAGIGECLGGDVVHLALLQHRDAEDLLRDLPPHEEVGDDVDIGAQREVLVDGLDTGGLGLGGGCEPPLLACKEHAPAARGHPARDDLHQRRLAGAVVAEQRHHLAGAYAETDAAQRLDGAEPAGDTLQLQEGCRLGHHDTRDSGCCIIGSLSSRVSSWLNICPKRGESTDEIAEAAAPLSTTSRPSDSRSRGVVRLLRAATEFGSSPAAATRAASSSCDALPPMTMASGSNRFSTITTAERSSGATAVT